MSDLVASWLRTVVPGLWSAVIGSALAWLAVHAPWALDLLEALNIDPESAAFTAGVVTLTLAVWYAVWRRLEPRIPDWLTRLVLGSKLTPAYQLGTVYPVARYSTGDQVELVDGDTVTIDTILMSSDAEMASYQYKYPDGSSGLVHESEIARIARPRT